MQWEKQNSNVIETDLGTGVKISLGGKGRSVCVRMWYLDNMNGEELGVSVQQREQVQSLWNRKRLIGILGKELGKCGLVVVKER